MSASGAYRTPGTTAWGLRRNLLADKDLDFHNRAPECRRLGASAFGQPARGRSWPQSRPVTVARFPAMTAGAAWSRSARLVMTRRASAPASSGMRRSLSSSPIFALCSQELNGCDHQHDAGNREECGRWGIKELG